MWTFSLFRTFCFSRFYCAVFFVSFVLRHSWIQQVLTPRMSPILARKMRHNAQQSDNNVTSKLSAWMRSLPKSWDVQFFSHYVTMIMIICFAMLLFSYLTYFFWKRLCVIWRITQSKEGVIQRCCTSRWMTPTDICISVCIFASLFEAYSLFR